MLIRFVLNIEKREKVVCDRLNSCYYNEPWLRLIFFMRLQNGSVNNGPPHRGSEQFENIEKMLSSIENISLTLTKDNSKSNNNSNICNNNSNGNGNIANTANIITGNNGVQHNNVNTINNKNQENISPQINGGTGKVPKAILICQPNSHSFLDRTLILDKPAKIGRSVGHAKASLNNGIFDCKVLSRNHALIWYADEKFYLKDTKSSNGTFVNRERLSRSMEESSPQEIFSGDTVQFGVDVVESSHNVTHGCIIATMKLFLPDGREAKPKAVPTSLFAANSGSSVCDKGSKVSLQDLYHLNEYIQEALQREQMLEAKLSSLRQLMQTLRNSTELGWKALISNNSLLSRVELLEIQLQCYSKKFAEDKLREELRLLQEDKNNYQGAVKEFFQKIVDEKLEAVQRYQDLARALVNSRTECNNTKQLLSGCQNELRELAHKNTVQENIIDDLENKLSLAEETNRELQRKLLLTSNDLDDRIKQQDDREDMLQRTVRDLQNRNECTEKKITYLYDRIEELQDYHDRILRELIDPNAIIEKVDNIELIRSWIFVYTSARKRIEECINDTKNKINELKNVQLMDQQKINSMRNDLRKHILDLEENKNEDSELEKQIRSLELEPEQSQLRTSVGGNFSANSGRNDLDIMNLPLGELQDKRKLQDVIRRNIKLLEEKCLDLERQLYAFKQPAMERTIEQVMEERKLAVAEKQLLNLDVALKTLTEYLENANSYHQDLIPVEEVQSLKRQLSEAHELSLDRQNIISCLTKYFSEFTNIVSQQLSVLEVSVEQFIECSTDLSELEQTIRSLKADSSLLANAISDLQNVLYNSVPTTNVASANVESQPPDDTTDTVCEDAKLSVSAEVVPLANSVSLQNYPVVIRTTNHNELNELKKDMLILKEKYRFVLNEKLLLNEQFVKLHQDYQYATSYPYFDLCFIMPIVVLVSIFFFKYGNIFSVFSNTLE